MSKMFWTEQQLEAINIRNTDTLVSAAAGSGKTAVLVERVIRRITDEENPVDIDRLLVVTFTNAAASQMKEKISGAIVSAIENDPGNQRLRKQLMLLGNAEINTIHSFCMNVIRSNFQDSGLPFEFGIINDIEKKMLKDETMEEVFAELYESEELCDDFERFVDSFSGNDDSDALSACLSLYDFLRTMPFYLDWLRDNIAIEPVNRADDTVWGRFILDYTRRMLVCAEDINRFLREFIVENEEAYGLGCYKTSVFEDAVIIDSLKKAVDAGVDEAYRAITGVSFNAIGRKTSKTDPESAQFVRDVRGEMVDIVKSLATDVFIQPPWQMCKIINLSLPYYGMLFEVISRFDTRYSEKKVKKAVVDFSDLEHKCARILSCEQDGEYLPSEAALKLRERFEEVLVDEYQDTNYLQETIINMVSGEGKRFMVGDVKQSIYEFRNSKPQLFLEKYNSYARVAGCKNRRLLLSKNFRSAEHILGFVNFVFSRLMSEKCGGLDYGDDEKLYFGDGYSCGDSTDLYIFDTNEYDDELKSSQREALFCASKIREMVDEGYKIEDNGKLRECRYSDFTIILRNANQHTDTYRAAFERYDIPLYVDKGSSYFDSAEIKLFVSLLRVIDNPRQDVELVAVLRSHIFGFDDDALVDLRMRDKYADIYSCLKTAYRDGHPKTVFFFDTLDRWRFIAANRSVRCLCETLIDECNMSVVFPEGRDKLRALCDWAERFGKTSYRGLFRFITFLQNQIEENDDIGGNGTPTDECVTLMSIHKSKGLENGIVILADTSHRFNSKELNETLLYSDKLGINAFYADTENRIRYNTLPRIAAKCKYYNDSRSEELRLLYVALTRAKFKLIIVGTLRNFEKHISGVKGLAACKDEQGFSAVASVSCNNHLDFLLSALVFHSGCHQLHECGGDFIEKSDPGFDVRIVNNPLIPSPPSVKMVQMPIAISDDNYDNVKNVLEYEYPFALAATVPSKLSVSEIKSRFYAEITDDETVFYPQNLDSSTRLVPEPEFMSDSKKLSASAIGTAYHSILQYLDFSGKFVLEDKLDTFVTDGIITASERKAIDERVVERFLDSPICRSIAEADEVFREYSFIMPYDSSELFGGDSETIMVQGIIDCVYRKDGEYYVVDYKSDSYSSSIEIADRYRTQLIMYSKAVEKRLGKIPAQCALYMLKTGEVIIP